MKPSILIMFIGWASVFTLTWLFILRMTPFDSIGINSWIFFFVVALFASMAQTQKKPESLKGKIEILKKELIDEAIKEKKND